MTLIFDEFELDADGFELRRQGEPCALELKVFDLICHFAKNPNRVFTYDELIAEVWRGRFVAETTISTCIKNARKALGDSGSEQRYIKTVRGRGFRFNAEVRERTEKTRPADMPRRQRSTDREITAPTLLIWPFRCLGDERDVQTLATALVTDLSRILTRVPLLRIRAEARRPPDGLSPSPRTLHETLGLDYVLDGTLQQVGGRYRLNAQLVDGHTGFQLWGEQFTIDGPLAQALDQAPIAIIAKLEPQLQRAIYAKVRSHNGPPNSRQLFLEASSVLVLKGWRGEAFAEAAELLRKSCAQDPQFALAHSFLALVLGFGDRVGLMSDRAQTEAESLAAAERAMELDNLDSTVLGNSGCALADIGYFERAEPILQNAVEMNPANAQAWAARGSAILLAHRIDEGIRYLQHGIDISPLDPRLSVWGTILAMGLMQAGRLKEALTQAQLACQRDDRCYLPRVALAGVHLRLGERTSAGSALQQAYRIKADLTPPQIAAIVGRELGETLQSLH